MEDLGLASEATHPTIDVASNTRKGKGKEVNSSLNWFDAAGLRTTSSLVKPSLLYSAMYTLKSRTTPPDPQSNPEASPLPDDHPAALLEPYLQGDIYQEPELDREAPASTSMQIMPEGNFIPSTVHLRFNPAASSANTVDAMSSPDNLGVEYGPETTHPGLNSVHTSSQDCYPTFDEDLQQHAMDMDHYGVGREATAETFHLGIKGPPAPLVSGRLRDVQSRKKGSDEPLQNPQHTQPGLPHNGSAPSASQVYPGGQHGSNFAAPGPGSRPQYTSPIPTGDPALNVLDVDDSGYDGDRDFEYGDLLGIRAPSRPLKSGRLQDAQPRSNEHSRPPQHLRDPQPNSDAGPSSGQGGNRGGPYNRQARSDRPIYTTGMQSARNHENNVPNLNHEGETTSHIQSRHYGSPQDGPTGTTAFSSGEHDISGVSQETHSYSNDSNKVLYVLIIVCITLKTAARMNV
jgi:hypothetical protein